MSKRSATKVRELVIEAFDPEAAQQWRHEYLLLTLEALDRLDAALGRLEAVAASAAGGAQTAAGGCTRGVHIPAREGRA